MFKYDNDCYLQKLSINCVKIGYFIDNVEL